MRRLGKRLVFSDGARRGGHHGDLRLLIWYENKNFVFTQNRGLEARGSRLEARASSLEARGWGLEIRG